MRITLTSDEATLLHSSILSISTFPSFREFLSVEEQDSVTELYHKISEELCKNVSDKKKTAAAKATQVRSKKAKQKIENAINMLRLQNIEITTYTVSLESGCSFNTCKKYKEYWKK